LAVRTEWYRQPLAFRGAVASRTLALYNITDLSGG